MSNWRIILTDGLKEKGQNILKASAEVDDRTGISAEELAEVLHQYDGMIVRGRTKVTVK